MNHAKWFFTWIATEENSQFCSTNTTAECGYHCGAWLTLLSMKCMNCEHKTHLRTLCQIIITDFRSIAWNVFMPAQSLRRYRPMKITTRAISERKKWESVQVIWMLIISNQNDCCFSRKPNHLQFVFLFGISCSVIGTRKQIETHKW